MSRQRLFVASCVSLVTTSMVFAIRGDIETAMSATFQLSKGQMGTIWSPAFWAFTIAIFISGALVDMVGLRSLHILSALGYFVGVGLVLAAPHPTAPVDSIFAHTGTTLLYIGFLVMGLSQGLVEGVINPLVATIYSDQKTKRLNMLHAWWPGGLIIGGLLAVAMTQTMNATWQMKLGTILVPAAIYLLMALTMPYPQTERVASKVSTGDMWAQAAKPLFLLLFVCMWMTAAAELGPDQWFPTVMGALVPQLQGVLFLVYTAGLMFVLRTFGSGIAHKNPIGTLFVCSILTGLGLYWLGSLQPGTSAIVAFAAATLFGVGKTYFWPTMIGVTAEQFPRGGALLISLMGGAGMLSVAVALPIMGARIDKLGPAAALQMVAVLGGILAIVFGGLFMYFKARGGYRAIQLGTDRAIAGGEL
ncbi:MAG TPA: MFS transporter [Vicinamibacterales bacterium]|nr:MFS transporter [Vicinamibacterales bacterium]